MSFLDDPHGCGYDLWPVRDDPWGDGDEYCDGPDDCCLPRLPRRPRQPIQEITIAVERLVAETEKAWLLVTTHGECWYPKSQCKLNMNEHKLTLPCWLYDAKWKEVV